jgi:predicted transglutaminase-like cysteine proteinase
MGRLAILLYVLLLGGGLCACASTDGALSAIRRTDPAPDSGQHPDALRGALPGGLRGEAVRDAKAPSGYLAFCDRNPGECRVPRGQPDTIAWTPEIWATLEKVNIAVNSTVRPLDDSEHYGITEFWTVPVDGEGDCEDYVLAKRKMLTLLGVAAPALRITVAFDKNNVRHAVLTVVTDHGDYVLDNLQDEILPPDQTGYIWVERQDAASRSGWVALN